MMRLEVTPTSHLLFDLSDAGVVGSNVNDFIQINGSLVLDGVLDVSDRPISTAATTRS